MKTLILASTSPFRRALMDGLKLQYQAESPGVEEDVPASLGASDVVKVLALRKAEAVFARHPKAWVLGSDQVVEVNGEILNKPPTVDVARAQLRKLVGTTHAIHTGVALLGPGFREVTEEVAQLSFYPVADGELERYLALGEWEGCAGSYRVEAAGQALLQRLEEDRSNVQGLPMLTVVRLLRQAGFQFF